MIEKEIPQQHLPDKIYKFIKENGYLTGSSSYSNKTKPNDIDIFMNSENYYSLLKMLDDVNISRKDAAYQIGIYTGKFNFFCISGAEFPKWLMVTELIQKMCKNTEFESKIINDKEYRVRVFRTLLAII